MLASIQVGGNVPVLVDPEDEKKLMLDIDPSAKTGSFTMPTIGITAPDIVCTITNSPVYPSIGLTKTTSNPTQSFPLIVVIGGATNLNAATIRYEGKATKSGPKSAKGTK